jgi:PEP-CTERM motif
MTRTRLIVATLALAVVGRANAQIVNGGFETGSLSPWYQGSVVCTFGPSCTPWSVTTDEAHSGLYSAVDEGNIELRQDFVTPIFGGDITSFTYWAMQDVPAISEFVFYYTDASTTYNVFDIGSDWEQFDALPYLDPTKTVSGFSVFGDSGPDVDFTYLDDFNIATTSETPEPGSMALLATGLVGLAGIGRRRRKSLLRQA